MIMALKFYLTHNEEKSAVAERFIRTLKNKIYKYMTIWQIFDMLLIFTANKSGLFH